MDLGRELSLVCVEVSLARNEPSVRGGQSWTKTIGIKVCGSFCHSTGTGIEPKTAANTTFAPVSITRIPA